MQYNVYKAGGRFTVEADHWVIEDSGHVFRSGDGHNVAHFPHDVIVIREDARVAHPSSTAGTSA